MSFCQNGEGWPTRVGMWTLRYKSLFFPNSCGINSARWPWSAEIRRLRRLVHRCAGAAGLLRRLAAETLLIGRNLPIGDGHEPLGFSRLLEHAADRGIQK